MDERFRQAERADELERRLAISERRLDALVASVGTLRLFVILNWLPGALIVIWALVLVAQRMGVG